MDQERLANLIKQLENGEITAEGFQHRVAEDTDDAIEKARAIEATGVKRIKSAADRARAV
jgi:hypothetical protein